MTDIDIRPITEAERRPCADVLGKSLLNTAITDEKWERFAPSFTVERRIGAFDGTIPVGIASSFGTRLAVPGGALLPAAAVNGVGVRADHTRRGIATRLMRAQLQDVLDRGEVLAALHASEATIYGHFGYGVGTRSKSLRVRNREARLRPEVPGGGSVRLLEGKDAMSVPREIYGRIGASRPGMIERAADWWSRGHDSRVGEQDPFEVVAFRGESGVDEGFATYRIHELESFADPLGGAEIHLMDLQVANPAALAGLWRYLVSVDLIDAVLVHGRPLDEPVESMFTDPRACQVTMVDDQLWLRILDVPAALAARGYGAADAVRIEVTDDFLPQNSGDYRIGPSGVDSAGTTGAAELRLDVETLSMIYLGAWRPSVLAGIGRIEVREPAALARADALFATAAPPWCGSGF